MRRPKLKTKADLESYVCDLEIELAYEQQDNEKLRQELDQALDIIQEIAAGQVVARSACAVLEPRFTVANPGGVQ